MIAGGVGEILGDPQIPFGGLDGGMAEGELDLFEWRVALMGQLVWASLAKVRRTSCGASAVASSRP